MAVVCATAWSLEQPKLAILARLLRSQFLFQLPAANNQSPLVNCKGTATYCHISNLDSDVIVRQ